MKTNKILIPVCIIVTCIIMSCGDPTDGMSGGSADITRDAVEYYLAEEKLNSPGVAVSVTTALNNGQEYKEVIKDENKKTTTLRAWIDRKDKELFCITYYRDKICPKCGGTGVLKLPEKMQDSINTRVNFANFSINCNQCGGSGYLEKALEKKCWILGVADYRDPAAAIAREDANALVSAPPGTEHQVENLASDDPAVRLEACKWLNQNYIRPGLKLTEITPILERARFISPVKDNSIFRKVMGKATGQHEYTVYQFWAGKGNPQLAEKAYYRIYVDATAGEVLKSTFAAEISANQRRRR